MYRLLMLVIGEFINTMNTKGMSPTNTGNIGMPPSNTTNGVDIIPPQKSIQPHINVAKSHFSNWLMGFVLSLLPLFVIPLVSYMENNDACGAWHIFSTNSELLFVGISIAVTAVNDFIGNANTEADAYWTRANFILVVSGTILYTIMVVFNYMHPDNNNNNLLTYFPIIYLCISFILGCIKYVKNIKNQKGGNDND